MLMCKNFLIIFFIILFVSAYNFIFSSSNSLIGVGIITALLMFKDIDLGLKRVQGAMIVLLLLLASVGMPFLASYNPFVGFIINSVSLYYIVMLTSERVDYKAYIGFVLIYIFADGTPVYGKDFMLRAISIILFALIITGIYYIKHKNDTELKYIHEVLESKHIENMSFALKLAFSLSLAMFLSSIFELEKHMWFTITVMSLTQLHLDVTFSRMKHRLIYTVVGSLLYIVVFVHIIPDAWLVYVTLGMSYIYTFIKSYHIQIIFITISSMIANEIFFPNELESIYVRIYLVAMGAIFCYAMTKIDFEKILKKYILRVQDTE